MLASAVELSTCADERATKHMSARRSNIGQSLVRDSLAHARGARLPRPTQDENGAIVRLSPPWFVLVPRATRGSLKPVPTPPGCATMPMRDGGKVRDDSTFYADRLSAVWACSARRLSASRSCIPSTAAATAPPARGAIR